MFPWERRQMDGNSGPLRTWERFYWGLFVGGLALLLFNRLPSRQPEVADPKARGPDTCGVLALGYPVSHIGIDTQSEI